MTSPLEELERLKAEWEKSVHDMRCQPNSGINQLNLAAAETAFSNALFRSSLYLIAAAREREELRKIVQEFHYDRAAIFAKEFDSDSPHLKELFDRAKAALDGR